MMNRRNLTPIVSALLVAALAPAPAAGEPAPPAAVREHVELALSAIETVPDREALLRIHPQVEQVLRQIVASPSRRALARSRALAVLRHFPSEATRATLKQAMDQALAATRGHKRPSVELLDLQQAMVSYALTAGPRALAAVQPQLSHWNLDVRAAAALATRLTGDSAALPALEARIKLETSPTVRVRLQQQIEALKAGPKARGGR
jgi:hypothetical protein